MKAKQKRELTWIGKENRPRLEPRILLEDPERSYHAARRVSENYIFDNRLIFGDNLLALKALEQEFTGEAAHLIECIETNTESHCNVADAYITHEVIFAADRSGKEGKPVALPLA